MSYATSLVIEDANGSRYPVPYLSPAVITISRGTEPSSVEFMVPDTELGETAIDDFENPCKIHITTPDKYNNESTLTLENWHIQARTPAAPGMFKVVLFDCRVLAQQRLLTAEYNVYIANNTDEETPRESSLNGGALWTAYLAAKDAIEQFGLEYEDDPDLDPTLKSVLLPKNLGNHIAGGFRGATWGFAMPMLLDAMRCDIVVRPNGKVTISDRHTRVSDDLDQYVAVEGTIGTRKQHWTWPREIHVVFDTRVERYFYINEDLTVSTNIDLRVDNVIPETEITESESPRGHRLLEETLRDYGVDLGTLQRNWLSPILIPREDPGMLLEELRERRELDAQCRYGYRTLFRIADQEYAGLTNIRMGHIGIDGKTVSERCVYMPYEKVELHTAARGRDLREILHQFMSSGLPIHLRKPTPWVPAIGYDATGEMIVKLNQDTSPGLPAEHIPGRLVNRAGRYESMRYGDALDISTPNVNLPTGTQLFLDDEWDCYVFYHGLLTVDRPDLGIDRLHVEELSMFPNGAVDHIEVKVSNLTANYKHDRSSFDYGDSPGRTGIPLNLINRGILEDRAEEIRDQVKKNFEEGQAGVLQTVGVDAIVNGGKWVTGNINSLMIKFGSEKPYTVKCQWVAMPEVQQVRTEGPIDGAPTVKLG